MTVDDDDRLATWNGQTTVSDNDGNLTTGPLNGSLTTFTFDQRNRLTAVGGNTYTYDAENRRVVLTCYELFSGRKNGRIGLIKTPKTAQFEPKRS